MHSWEDIHQVAVIGVPDERMGEVGMAFVVPAPGASLTPESVIAWCRGNMANYKVPRRVEIVDSLPMNATGKVTKFVLRERVEAGTRSMAAEKIEAVVRKLSDLEAIRELTHRYAHCVWRKQISAAVDLFTEDGEMNTGDRPVIRGQKALLESYQQMLGAADFHPFVHNHLITLQGDNATGTVTSICAPRSMESA